MMLTQPLAFIQHVEVTSTQVSHFLLHIGDVEEMLRISNSSAFLSETFKRVALLVSGVRLNDHIVDVVFKMFDENGKVSRHPV